MLSRQLSGRVSTLAWLLLIAAAAAALTALWFARLLEGELALPPVEGSASLAPPAPWPLRDLWRELLLPLEAALALVLGLQRLRPGGWGRWLVVATVMAFAARYLHWRLGTLNSGVQIGQLLAPLVFGLELIVLLTLLFPLVCSAAHDPGRRPKQAGVIPPKNNGAPPVDVLIRCGQVAPELVRRALLSAGNLRGSGRVGLLGAEERPDLASLRRSTPGDQKGPAAELVAVIHADMVPFGNLLHRCQGFFRDPAVAMVQTPTAQFESEFYSRNLGVDLVMAGDRDSEQHTFEALRDDHNAVLGGNGCFLARQAALAALPGGLDQACRQPRRTTALLQRRGWRVVHLNETLSVAESPRTFAAYLEQRRSHRRADLRALLEHHLEGGATLWQRAFHWHQILRHSLPLLGGLLVILPLLALAAGFSLIQASLLGWLGYGLPFLLVLIAILPWISGGHWQPLRNVVVETLLGLPSGRAPRQGGGDTRSEGQPPRATEQSLRGPQAVVLLGLIGMLLLTLVMRYVLPMLPSWEGGLTPTYQGEGLMLLWNLSNGALLLVCLLCCIDQPVQRRGDRLPIVRECRLELGGYRGRGESINFSESGGGLLLSGDEPPALGATGWLELLPEQLRVPVSLVRCERSGREWLVGVSFLEPLTPAISASLLELLYGGGLALRQPDPTRALLSLLSGLWRAEPVLRR